MNMIYNSSNYCVVEFGSYATVSGGGEGKALAESGGGFEIMDKTAKREIFLGGALADHFRKNVAELIATEPSVEEIDDFLSRFDTIMHQSLTVH